MISNVTTCYAIGARIEKERDFSSAKTSRLTVAPFGSCVIGTRQYSCWNVKPTTHIHRRYGGWSTIIQNLLAIHQNAGRSCSCSPEDRFAHVHSLPAHDVVLKHRSVCTFPFLLDEAQQLKKKEGVKRRRFVLCEQFRDASRNRVFNTYVFLFILGD